MPEDPETKRRLKNLLDVTGLLLELDVASAPAASIEDLLRIHPKTYLDAFQAASDSGGGELGLRAPFGQGGFEIAALSAGLVKGALFSVLEGRQKNAYALARPPGHHCLPDFPNGFCLLANIAIAIEAAKAVGLVGKVAVVDWDVHHGNGTEAIFYDRSDVLTVSIHQDHNYPLDTGDCDSRGSGEGLGCNMNIPLPPGAGQATYLQAVQQLVVPALARFQPDVIIVACGYDASAIDPLSRMLCTAQTFALMTEIVMKSAAALCQDRLVMAHEGGYSEVYVPFCGHAVLAQMASSTIEAPDPLARTLHIRQPDADMEKYFSNRINALEDFFGLG